MDLGSRLIFRAHEPDARVVNMANRAGTDDSQMSPAPT